MSSFKAFSSSVNLAVDWPVPVAAMIEILPSFEGLVKSCIFVAVLNWPHERNRSSQNVDSVKSFDRFVEFLTKTKQKWCLQKSICDIHRLPQKYKKSVTVTLWPESYPQKRSMTIKLMTRYRPCSTKKTPNMKKPTGPMPVRRSNLYFFFDQLVSSFGFCCQGYFEVKTLPAIPCPGLWNLFRKSWETAATAKTDATSKTLPAHRFYAPHTNRMFQIGSIQNQPQRPIEVQPTKAIKGYRVFCHSKMKNLYICGNNLKWRFFLPTLEPEKSVRETFRTFPHVTLVFHALVTFTQGRHISILLS